MNKPGPTWGMQIVLLVTMGLSTAAHADFYAAYKDYKDGKFADAATQFRDLAELGNGPSQFNLGVMNVRGEGMDKNQGAGMGWLLAAHENGYQQMTAEKLADLRSKLTPEQVAEADKVVAAYGRRALERDLLPGRPSMQCRSFRSAHIEQRARANYPVGALHDRRDGVVLIEVTVGVDGLARDPHVLVSVPDNVFDDSTIDVFMKSRFTPAVRDGQKIESRMLVHFTFFIESGGSLWKLGSVKKVREAAEQKVPNAQYVIGMIGSLDSTLNVPAADARTMLIESAQAGHPNAQYWAAHQVQLDQLCGNGGKMTTWLEHSSRGGDPSAQIELASYRVAKNDASMNPDEIKKLIASAAAADDPYAMKHAIALSAASPLEAIRDPQLALATATRLKKYDGNLDPQVEEAMAAAYGANGNFRDAIKFQERAIKKGREIYWNTQTMEERLAAYNAGKSITAADLFAVPAALTPPPPVKDEGINCREKKHGCERHPDDKRSPTGSFIR